MLKTCIQFSPVWWKMIIFNQGGERSPTRKQACSAAFISRATADPWGEQRSREDGKKARCLSDSWMCSRSGARFPSGCQPAVGGLRFKDWHIISLSLSLCFHPRGSPSVIIHTEGRTCVMVMVDKDCHMHHQLQIVYGNWLHVPYLTWLPTAARLSVPNYWATIYILNGELHAFCILDARLHTVVLYTNISMIYNYL